MEERRSRTHRTGDLVMGALIASDLVLRRAGHSDAARSRRSCSLVPDGRDHPFQGIVITIPGTGSDFVRNLRNIEPRPLLVARRA